jgi:hypothetical protein
MHRSGAAVGGVIRLPTVMVHRRDSETDSRSFFQLIPRSTRATTSRLSFSMGHIGLKFKIWRNQG